MKKAVKLVNGDEQETGTYSLGDGHVVCVGTGLRSLGGLGSTPSELGFTVLLFFCSYLNSLRKECFHQ